ncbi:catalase, partial [Enterococcus faecalis]|uniref:catalase n=1 Tax=Enterococcus faecalis TaxID=1351 RepID=UPI0021DFCC9D
ASDGYKRQLKVYNNAEHFDLVDNNTPIFFIHAAIKFPNNIHKQQRNPWEFLNNSAAIFDLWSHLLKGLHQASTLLIIRSFEFS